MCALKAETEGRELKMARAEGLLRYECSVPRAGFRVSGFGFRV